jgi:hypothetical protein
LSKFNLCRYSTGDNEFLATIRHVFLASLNTTYDNMIHSYELPQESGGAVQAKC